MDIRTEFSRQLADIEAEMRSVLAEQDGSARPLYEMLAYHLGLDHPEGPRGKRIRPLLGLLAYQSLGGDFSIALPGAAAVELGHNFSLVHDDIEDADVERRHRPTLWAIWGVPLAINAGDALFALSRLALYRLLSKGIDEHKVLELMHVYDQTCLKLCEGQYLDISFERRLDVTVDEYMEMIRKKTAALIGASIEAGSVLASDDEEVHKAYRRFGEHMGIAFQMADDVKGSFWTSEASGKAEAGDLRKRKKTLPIIWGLTNAPEPDRSRLKEIYRPVVRGTDGRPRAGGDDAPLTDEQIAEVLVILDRCGARDYAMGEARRMRDLALTAIDELPCPEPERLGLRRVAEAVIET